MSDAREYGGYGYGYGEHGADYSDNYNYFDYYGRESAIMIQP